MITSTSFFFSYKKTHAQHKQNPICFNASSRTLTDFHESDTQLFIFIFLDVFFLASSFISSVLTWKGFVKS